MAFNKGILQQQRLRPAPNSNHQPDGKSTNGPTCTSTAYEALKAIENNKDTAFEQRIVAEKAAFDQMFSGYFDIKSGIYIVKELKTTQPLTTKFGQVVPTSHVRLSVRMAEHGSHWIHLHAHPYLGLEFTALADCLVIGARALGSIERNGVFEIALGVRFRFVKLVRHFLVFLHLLFEIPASRCLLFDCGLWLNCW